MNNYEKKFHSTCGGEFLADVYSVLVAFGVTCPARGHAVKKLLMPGQRGSKGEVQDLDEAITSVARAVELAYARLRDSHGASDEPEPIAEAEAEPEPIAEPEPKPEPMKGAPITKPASAESIVEPKPKLVAWRKCVRITPGEINSRLFYVDWYPSGSIPEYWHPLVASLHPVETFKELPEGQDPNEQIGGPRL